MSVAARVKQIDKYKDVHTKYTSTNSNDVGWTKEGSNLVDETMLNHVSTNTNADTYVDTDGMFYDGIIKNTGGNPVFVLNTGSGRKRKRRKNEL